MTGCSKQSTGVSDALEFRQRLSKAEKITFDAHVTADYGNRMYVFDVSCVAQSDGCVAFTVLKPETIAGITGSVSASGGKLTFDDTVLLFEPLTQGQITPAIGPWLMMKAIFGGYVRAVSDIKDGVEFNIDDTFKSESFQMTLKVNQEQEPIFCEIIWNNRRILSIQINNFTVM